MASHTTLGLRSGLVFALKILERSNQPDHGQKVRRSSQ